MSNRSSWVTLVLWLAIGFSSLGPSGNAAVISPGTPTTNVPSSLSDPLSTLSSPLLTGQFLLPVDITGANGLQDWSFDLHFDANRVAPLDLGGFFAWVYQTQFSATNPALSDITASGFP